MVVDGVALGILISACLARVGVEQASVVVNHQLLSLCLVRVCLCFGLALLTWGRLKKILLELALCPIHVK